MLSLLNQALSLTVHGIFFNYTTKEVLLKGEAWTSIYLKDLWKSEKAKDSKILTMTSIGIGLRQKTIEFSRRKFNLHNYQFKNQGIYRVTSFLFPAEDTMYFRQGSQKPLNWPQFLLPKVWFLWYQKETCEFQMRAPTNSPTQKWCVRCTTTTSVAQQPSECSSGTHSLLVTNCSPTGQWEIMPGTGHLANYPGPVRSQILEKNLQLSLYQTSTFFSLYSE